MASGSPFKLSPMSFWHLFKHFVTFGVHNIFKVIILYFLDLKSRISHFSMKLCFLSWRMVCRTKIWSWLCWLLRHHHLCLRPLSEQNSENYIQHTHTQRHARTHIHLHTYKQAMPTFPLGFMLVFLIPSHGHRVHFSFHF